MEGDQVRHWESAWEVLPQMHHYWICMKSTCRTGPVVPVGWLGDWLVAAGMSPDGLIEGDEAILQVFDLVSNQ